MGFELTVLSIFIFIAMVIIIIGTIIYGMIKTIQDIRKLDHEELSKCNDKYSHAILKVMVAIIMTAILYVVFSGSSHSEIISESSDYMSPLSAGLDGLIKNMAKSVALIFISIAIWFVGIKLYINKLLKRK